MIARSRRLSASIGSFADNRFTNFRHIQIIQEIEDNPDLLNPRGPLLLWRIDDDLFDKLVYNGRCQLRDVHIFLDQSGELVKAVVHFLAGGYPVLKADNLIVKIGLLRFIAFSHFLVAFLAQITQHHVFVDTGHKHINIR